MTERQVQQVIEKFYAIYETDEPFRWKVTGTKVGASKVTYDYRIQPMKLYETDWEYAYRDSVFSTQGALIELLAAASPSDPGCPQTRVAPSEWTNAPGFGVGDDGSNIAERAEFGIEISSMSPLTGTCSAFASNRSVKRTRTAK